MDVVIQELEGQAFLDACCLFDGDEQALHLVANFVGGAAGSFVSEAAVVGLSVCSRSGSACP